MTRETRAIVRELAAVQLADLVPPDVEAIEHAKTHHAEAAASVPSEPALGGTVHGMSDEQTQDLVGLVKSVGAVEKEAQEAQERWKAKVDELGKLKQRLMKVVAALSLEVEVYSLKTAQRFTRYISTLLHLFTSSSSKPQPPN